MSQTKPCPYCERTIVDNAKACCFCGHALDATRLTATAVCFALPDGEASVIPMSRIAEPQLAAVIHPFPLVAATDAPPTAQPAERVTRKDAEPAAGASGEPPDRRRGVFSKTPPLKAVVLILSLGLLSTATGLAYPERAFEFALFRGILSVAGLYWLLLAPFTERTPAMISAMYMPMILSRHEVGGPRPELRTLDLLLTFLIVQALAISWFRVARWKGRGLMAVSQLDETDESARDAQPTRCASFDV